MRCAGLRRGQRRMQDVRLRLLRWLTVLRVRQVLGRVHLVLLRYCFADDTLALSDEKHAGHRVAFAINNWETEWLDQIPQPECRGKVRSFRKYCKSTCVPSDIIRNR